MYDKRERAPERVFLLENASAFALEHQIFKLFTAVRRSVVQPRGVRVGTTAPSSTARTTGVTGVEV